MFPKQIFLTTSHANFWGDQMIRLDTRTFFADSVPEDFNYYIGLNRVPANESDNVASGSLPNSEAPSHNTRAIFFRTDDIVDHDNPNSTFYVCFQPKGL